MSEDIERLEDVGAQDAMDGQDQPTADDDLAALAQDLRRRGASYTFLSRALSDENVTSGLVSALRSNPPHTGSDLDTFAHRLRGDGDEQDDALLEQAGAQIAADHAALFSSNVAERAQGRVCPLESGNRDDHAPEQIRASVKDSYRQQDFSPASGRYVPGADTPADHICVELSFVAHLTDRAAARIETILSGACEGDPEAEMQQLSETELAMNTQYVFIEDHLLPWVPRLSDAIEERASTAFYRGVAQLLRQLIVSEAHYLDQLDTTGSRG